MATTSVKGKQYARNRTARARGNKAEALLLSHLMQEGYEVRRTHLSLFPDIIAWTDTDLLLIEVKSRTSKPDAVTKALSTFRSSVRMMTKMPKGAILLCYLRVNSQWIAYEWRDGVTVKVEPVISKERYAKENES
jgi:Holliday junction resolvase-like predicted endonuclease